MSNQRNFCSAKNKQGQPCGAAAGASDYCYFHTNPGVAAQVGRMGGGQNSHVIEGHATPLPPLNSISSVQAAIAQTIADVHARRLQPKTAAGLSNLFSVLLRTFGPDRLEERLKTLEETINARESAKSTDKAGEN